mgnify:CR=1 FL=1
MAADDKKADAKKKYLDKYETEEELVKAYADLEKKLGGQGEELGTLRKQGEEAQKALMEYAKYVQQVKPQVDWVAQNQQALQQYQQWLQNGGTRQVAAPTPAAGRNNLLDLMTPEEKQMLYSEAAKSFESSVFKPWQQQFGTQLQKMADERAKQVADQMAHGQRAFTEVLWRTMQRGFPEDKIKEMREWHEQALAMADPSKFDPMKAADEHLRLRGDLSRMTDEKKALQTEYEKLQKQTLPPAGGEPPAQWVDKTNDTAPKNRDERYSRVMDNTKETVGAEAFKDFFGTLR